MSANYYLSMEFLIGRSLTNNITNLLLSRLVSEAVKQTSLDWLAKAFVSSWHELMGVIAGKSAALAKAS